MSVRAVLSKFWHNGRGLLFRNCRPLQTTFPGGGRILPQRRVSGATVGGLRARYEGARRLFVDNVLRRVTNSLSADLRERTTRQLLFGNSTPFFALVGVSLASGTGIITKEDELDGVCWEIREAVARMQRSLSNAESDLFEEGENVGLNKFTIGPLIAKGSNAVVYAARKNSTEDEDGLNGLKMCLKEPMLKFPFAMKLMFNYDAESNAMSILRSMRRETVPARLHYTSEDMGPWQDSLQNEMIGVPAHPNVVSMHCVFADYMPSIPGSLSVYPDALPARINPDGSGRNMSLFLLMKRYDMSLKDYLSSGTIETRESVLLLTQLLEAVCHINRHSVAHRDLKSDNVLVETTDDKTCPSLVVTDFGCCLSDRRNGLLMPYRTLDTDKGGNAALMAPEVALTEPGLFSYIDYSKSDVWAAGTIGYELLCGHNPFYRRGAGGEPPLSARTYTEDRLPQVPEQVPWIIRRLLPALLTRNPSKRPNAELAATVCQLHLWAPTAWLEPLNAKPLPSSSEMLQWLLCLATKVLCTDHAGGSQRESSGGRRAAAEYQLIASFLSRARLAAVRSALAWIHTA